ncbi:conjugal transfer protein TrbL [Aeromicrobium sp. PE09-221]|uniref:conjugal transfer protein TrbL n=1 Tax=Aeromicrobium sp. PE09-221 TaxID=1898043 RepID=UPI000B3E9929|nr:conjugal transfer protein TrbL [Aeromicrobium sp. PE09-221]OUZ10225.1 conjugal transfer protein TrbL [Aeromicrobium sp. PE09-221]
MVDVCGVPVISTVCDVAGDAAGALVSAPFDWLAQAMGGAAAWMFESMWKVFDSTTMVDVTSTQYVRVYNILFGVAAVVMVGFFLLQVIGGMVRREPAALSRALLGLAKSILGSFVALALLATALEITDQICVGIVHAAGTNMEDMGDRIALLAGGLATLNIAAPGVGAIITIFIAGLAIGGAVIVWISLLIRKALLLIAIVFAPVALAGATWDHTRGWVSKWASFVIALIVSKVVVVVIFLLATAQVSAPIDADLKSVSEPIAGVVLMLIAAFAPYMAYKAISFMGFDMYHSMSMEQEAKAALNRPLPIPTTRRGGEEPKKVLDASNGGGGSGSSGPAPTPSSSPSGGAGVGGATAGGGSSAGGTSAASGAAGGVLAGAVVAKEAATAGPRVGSKVGASAEGHADGASQASQPHPQSAGSPPPPAPMVPDVADPTPAARPGGEKR